MLQMKASNNTAEILIYEDIGESWLGGISAKRFADEIKNLKNITHIDVRINSYGGSVFDGLAIYNTLKRHKATVNVSIDGIAASIASIIAMAGDQVTIASNGFMMIHDPWMIAAGSAADLREQADLMDKVRDELLDTYMKRVNGSVARDYVSDLMHAETWLNASEAVDLGLADNETEEVKLAACAHRNFKTLPDCLKPVEKPLLKSTGSMKAKMNQILKKRSM